MIKRISNIRMTCPLPFWAPVPLCRSQSFPLDINVFANAMRLHHVHGFLVVSRREANLQDRWPNSSKFVFLLTINYALVDWVSCIFGFGRIHSGAVHSGYARAWPAQFAWDTLQTLADDPLFGECCGRPGWWSSEAQLISSIAKYVETIGPPYGAFLSSVAITIRNSSFLIRSFFSQESIAFLFSTTAKAQRIWKASITFKSWRQVSRGSANEDSVPCRPPITTGLMHEVFVRQHFSTQCLRKFARYESAVALLL